MDVHNRPLTSENKWCSIFEFLEFVSWRHVQNTSPWNGWIILKMEIVSVFSSMVDTCSRSDFVCLWKRNRREPIGRESRTACCIINVRIIEFWTKFVLLVCEMGDIIKKSIFGKLIWNRNFGIENYWFLNHLVMETSYFFFTRIYLDLFFNRTSSMAMAYY